MKTLKILYVILISAFFAASFADQEEIVLQNGLNGYDGCIDAFVHNQNSSTNYGDATILEVRNDGS